MLLTLLPLEEAVGTTAAGFLLGVPEEQKLGITEGISDLLALPLASEIFLSLILLIQLKRICHSGEAAGNAKGIILVHQLMCSPPPPYSN